MRKIGLFAGVILGAVITCGCNGHEGAVNGKSVAGSGTTKSESRSVAGFNSITLNGVGKVVITQSGKEALTVTAEDNLLPLLQTHVVNGTLRLEVAPDVNLQPTKPIEYDIDVKKLANLSVEGAGELQASQLAGKELAISISGAGSVTLAGKVAHLSLSLDGAGNLDAAQLKAQQVTVASSGAGNAVVNASDQLTVNISGIGNVEYIGSPQVQQNISGMGKVTQRK